MDATEQPLEFPVECKHRILAKRGEMIHAAILMTLRQLNIHGELSERRRSEGGQYVTYTVTVRYESRTELRRVMNAISNTDGVKTVL